MIKSGQAGNIFPGNTGYLQIGLTTYDVKIVAAKKEEGNINQTNIRLVQYDKRKDEIKKEICGLTKEVAYTGNTFLLGAFNVGFGYMEIKLWYVAKESRKSDNSPIMFIVGTLQNEQNNSYKKIDTKDNNYDEVNLEALNDEVGKKPKEPIVTVFGGDEELDDISVVDIPDF